MTEKYNKSTTLHFKGIFYDKSEQRSVALHVKGTLLCNAIVLQYNC